MTRPDIIQAVFHLAQFAHNPSEKHWKALCGVVDYLSFNKDIGSWDISNVTTFYDMFYNASAFNQTLSWTIPDGAITTNMFTGTAGGQLA